jgi:1,4-dihydroxy-2-naphthoyl-CoA synthase
MRVPAATIGLCYPLKGIERFVEKLGVTMAKRILVAAETFSADEMLQAGILDHLVMPAQFHQVVDDFAGRIGGLAPLAVRAMKSVIQQAGKNGINWPESVFVNKDVAFINYAALAIHGPSAHNSFGGFSQTSLAISQFRVGPDHRSGRAAFAAS